MRAPAPNLERAYAHCERIAREHYENFPVASLLVPRALRPHVWAVYAFARRADDFADEPRFAGHRLRRLAAWERMLSAATGGRPRHPVFAALGHTIRTRALPEAPLGDLLSAFRQDVTVARYATYEALLDYCRRSADPVGRLVLALFDKLSPRRAAWSDALCTGLQLSNHWQDVGIDAARGRIYLPLEDLAAFGVAEEEILAGRMSDRFRNLLAFEIARTRDLFDRGKPLCADVGGRLGLELRAVWLGGTGILDAIERAGCDVFARRPAHGTADRLRLAAGALVPGRFRRPREVAHA
jgi:hydroxysqualene synthase